jgi:uncharacterized protein
MASTNQSPFYQRAEQEFHEASTDEERISCLEIMIKECPKHKSSENMLRNLTLRLKKLKSNLAKQKKSGKSKGAGIKKAPMQVVLAGFTNTGKSTLFKRLTKLETKISPNQFTTHESKLGTFKFENSKIQIIDSAPFPNHDKSLLNSTDTILLVLDDLGQIAKSEKYLYRTRAKIIMIYNKIDLLSLLEKRKMEATIKSKFKKYDFLMISSKNINKTERIKLTKKIFETFPIIRIYTKEPKKAPSKEPMIMKTGSRIKDVAEKILTGMSKRIKRARIWGPSSKFGGQSAGLEHKLKDKDIIEFQTK